jgi:hypothetical protein
MAHCCACRELGDESQAQLHSTAWVLSLLYCTAPPNADVACLQLYNPVTDLLVGSKDAAAPGAAADELAWPRMRTVAQLRRDMNTGAPVNPESVYK